MTGSGTEERRNIGLMALDRITWTKLATWRASFLSKAVMALSISALFLANVAPVLAQYDIPLPSMTRTFLGSLLYIAGWLVFAARVPSQLSRGGEIYDIVGRMKTLTDWNFFDNYRQDAVNAVNRIGDKQLYPKHIRTFLKGRSVAANALTPQTKNWIDQTAGLYQAYIQMRDHDRPFWRAVTALLLLGGTGALFWSAAATIVKAICTLL